METKYSYDFVIHDINEDLVQSMGIFFCNFKDPKSMYQWSFKESREFKCYNWDEHDSHILTDFYRTPVHIFQV